MKAILLILFVYLLNSAYGTNYYFSSVSGNDSRTDIEAQDPSTPWKTLDKLNSIFSTLKPGDSVLLKRDETFYGSINLQKSGSVLFPIIIGAYGTGERPVVTSLITLSGWVSKGKGVWETVDSTLGSSLNMVLVNGVEQEMGRYPNSNAPNKGYLNFESHEGKTSITDPDLNPSVKWNGAELVTRPRHWILNRSLITEQKGRTISYTTESPYEPYENYGYFIQNSIKTLDKVGEWFYDPSEKKLSVYFGAGRPSTYTVEAATMMNDLIFSKSRSNIIVDNINIKGSNSSGLHIENGSNIHIQNCDILFSGVTGVIVRNHKNFVIENCTVANSASIGIELEYGVTNATIKNNKILNTGILAGMMQNGEGIGLAISANGDGNIIEANEIRRTGFIGIGFYGSDIIMKNNLIDSFCFVKDDGGGIYSHGGPTETTNRKIVGNIILNGVGAGPGTDHFDKRSVTGIYMDANITNVEILENTITTCNQGIFIQSSAGMIIKNNIVFNNVRQMTIIRDKDNNPVRNSVITQNTFFAKNPDQWAMYIMSSADDIKEFGRFDSNYYARPLDDRITIFTSHTTPEGNGISQNLNLEEWKQLSGQDRHSKRTAKQIIPFRLDDRKGANKFIFGGDFTTNVKGVNSTSCTSSWANSGKLDGGYLRVVPSSRGSSIYVKVDAVTAGKNYILSYSLRGSQDTRMSIGASLRQSGPPFTTITPLQSRKIDLTRSENQIVFSPLTTESSVNLTFKVDDESEYYLDNLEFYEAKVQVTDPDDSIRFEYNATNLNRLIPLNGNYIDAAGKLYMKKIVLKPYTSAVLIKTSDKVRNNPPKVNVTSPVADTVYNALSSVLITARATDIDGNIAAVEFYNGTTLLKTVDSTEFGFILDSVAPGNYSITARAIDNNGLATTSSPVTFSVSGLNTAPVVTISSPEDGTVFPPFSTILVRAKATDADGSIEKVEFYNGSTLLKTESKLPYDLVLDSLAPGNYSITVKAFDNQGSVSTSAPVAFTVDAPDVAPTVSITSPGDNAVFGPYATIAVNAVAADADGSVAKVEFYVGTILWRTDPKAPFNCTLDSLRPRTYTVTAKATDNTGLVTISSPVVFTVRASNTPPAVNITSPGDQSVFSPLTSVHVTADATDVDGTVAKVEFYNGSTLIKKEFEAPYECLLDNLPLGSYVITVRATDNEGAVTTSAPIAISVARLEVPPVISMVTPLDNATYLAGGNIYLNALASDPDGSISKVEFYNNGTLIYTAIEAPFSFKWEHVRTGSYTITASATDNTGLVTTSPAVTVSVVPNQVPTVDITSPGSDDIFEEGTTIRLQAEAADTDGRITRVEFYNGTTLIAAKYGAPYIINWKNAPLGNAVITARALDNWGAATNSSPVSISIIAATQPGISNNGTANEQTATASKPAARSSASGTAGSTSNISAQNQGISYGRDLAELKGFTVSPNPAVSMVQVYFDGLQVYQKADLIIQSSTGLVVKKYPVTISGKKIQVDVSSLSTGTYIITLSGNNFRVSKKLLKVN